MIGFQIFSRIVVRFPELFEVASLLCRCPRTLGGFLLHLDNKYPGLFG